ncbi:hypothetical protein DFH08DRAFT_815620 [Mycena albidolilacea]|uniref:Uncharacterized protein n=1 Tax=Mycena albidolilacea TaxID=1033008 RepID=A0AAD7EJK3_9AGAR|nr:hypothetical protein DFH08DRAFT_815620 [Mycena albidolilacea]
MSSTTLDILAPSNAVNQPGAFHCTTCCSVQDHNGHKQEEMKNDPESTQKTTYCLYRRNLIRSVGPFECILTIVEHGVTKALANSDDKEHEETEVYMMSLVYQSRLSHDSYKGETADQNWNTLKDTIPGFSREMIGLASKWQLHKHICLKLQGGLRGAHGDDINSLKAPISDYVKPLPIISDSGEPLPLPVLKFSVSRTKADQGFNNPHTAWLNTPVKHPATEETYTRIHNGEIIVLGTEMPYLMYCDGHVYNPDDMEDGLSEGSTLFAVVKHIYQGPSTALQYDGFTQGKAGNAALNGITALTGVWDYFPLFQFDWWTALMQVRFRLSSQDQWGHIDGNFSYRDFYWSIVDLLKGEEGQEIIDHFNIIRHQVLIQEVRPCHHCGAHDFEVLEAQHVARRVHKIAAAATFSAPA